MTRVRPALLAFVVLFLTVAVVTGEASAAPVRMTFLGPPGMGAVTLEGFEGREAISSLYRFRLDLAGAAGIRAEDVLGKELRVAVALPDGTSRYFSGICNRFTQGNRDSAIHYHAEVVPQFWLLTRRVANRIFQEKSVPEIIAQVLGETPGLRFEMRLEGTFHKRDYCVQYNESDFAFASRLMEEEGIYYFFRHAADGHTMVLANTPAGHADLPGALPYVYGALGAARLGAIQSWEKTQEIRSGKWAMTDDSFELPDMSLEVGAVIQESALAGGVTHLLAAGGGDALEHYDYPGRYAQRFDGIDPGGGERPGELAKILEDGRRTVGIRMQEEAARALVIEGASTAPPLTAGHKFQLSRHFDGDGPYVLTQVQHAARAAFGGIFDYRNTFTCIPEAVPYRPERITPKPVIPGPQTAFVVGPPGEEIFTDKYGRVKVQFHWDRTGTRDGDSSCWIRVGALHAGAESGSVVVPRIGWEVIVSFEGGDPDRPIIVGSVYNAGHLPPPDTVR